MLKKIGPLILFLGLLTFIIVSILCLLGPVVGNVFSNIQSPGSLWATEILTWVDENENGVWDTNEAPLGDVEITVAIIFEDHQEDFHFKSYWEGRRRFSTDVYGNISPKTIEISVKTPEGYMLTTPARESVGYRAEEYPILFGFAYLTGIPTVTPLPPQPVCREVLKGEAAGFTNIIVAPDGTIWVATDGNGAYQFNPVEGIWERYTTDDGLASNFVWTITVSPEGIVWFGTSKGITRFDGSLWTSYTEDGLSAGVVEVAVASDGSTWLSTREGDVAHFYLDTETWTIDDNYGHPMHILPSPDNKIWLGSQGYNMIVQVTPAITATEARQAYSFSDALIPPFDGAVGIRDLVLADNKLWVVYHRAWSGGYSAYLTENFGYFDLETEKWIEVQSVELFQYNNFTALALALDRSFWIGASEGLGHFIPTDADPSKGSWTYYYYSVDEVEVDSMVFAPDGTLWITTYWSIVQCVV